MRVRPLLLAPVVWLLACGSATMNPASPPGASLSGSPGLRVELRAPNEAPYKVSVLGPGDVHVGLRVTNVTEAPRSVDGLTVALAASRDGVPFECHVTTKGDDREPKVLPAGASFTFERDLGCTLPLPGRYLLEVYAALGRDPIPGANADHVGAFSLRIAATQANAPHEYPGIPGLFAVMSGNPFAKPLPKGAWAPGAYRVVVGVVNGGRAPLEAVAARVVFRVYKVGEALPCVESPVELRLPSRLDPGAVYLERIPITCVIGARGDYDLVGELEVGASTTPLELGRYRIHVTDEPTLDALPPP